MDNLSRPLKKFGNWQRLNSISDKRILTEIIMMAHIKISNSKYNIKSGLYIFGSLEVQFEVKNNLIFRIKGKFLEADCNPNELPNWELMPQQIPSFIIDCFNHILKVNGFSEVNFIKDTNWTKLIVNYKLGNETIASVIYPKIISLSNGYEFDFGDGKNIRIIQK